MIAHLTLKSLNKKTGIIPVSTTEESSCPVSCPWIKSGCYANAGPLKLHWKKVSTKERGNTWNEFIKLISKLPIGQLWRHNQAGDLPGKNKTINSKLLRQLINSSKGRVGFTYTHKPVEGKSKTSIRNRLLIKYLNSKSFIINLSANNISHAEKLHDLNIAPVTTIVSSKETRDSFISPKGKKIVVCPGTRNDNITCSVCKLCAILTRKSIIAFPAHGKSIRAIDRRLNE